MGRIRILTAVVVLLAVAACTTSDESGLTDEQRQALTAEQTAFLDSLDRTDVAVDELEAVAFMDWYCQNLVAPIGVIKERLNAIRPKPDDPDTRRYALTLATNACRVNEKNRGG